MCDRDDPNLKSPPYQETAQTISTRDNHMIYELKQKREYHIQQLVNIQKAIDAVSTVERIY